MNTTDPQQLIAEAQHQLALAHSQLTLYARDLKRMVDAEQQKARALAAANARLQILDRLKTDFLSFISHELRTPLNFMSAVDLFEPQSAPQEQAEVIDFIRKGYERLTRFIEKGLQYFHWLAIERVETTATTDLAAVVQRVVEQMPALAAPGVHFQFSTSGPSPFVRGEKECLAKVVHILLENAVKFSPQEKSITVGIHAVAEKTTLTIIDRGQGFAPELAQELFQPFTITDRTHHSHGTGLNLALANAIVKAHGGHLRAESTGIGQGATFTVELPVGRTHRSAR